MNQADGRDLAWLVEVLENVLPSLKTPARSRQLEIMESHLSVCRVFRAGSRRGLQMAS